MEVGAGYYKESRAAKKAVMAESGRPYPPFTRGKTVTGELFINSINKKVFILHMKKLKL